MPSVKTTFAGTRVADLLSTLVRGIPQIGAGQSGRYPGEGPLFFEVTVRLTQAQVQALNTVPQVILADSDVPSGLRVYVTDFTFATHTNLSGTTVVRLRNGAAGGDYLTVTNPTAAFYTLGSTGLVPANLLNRGAEPAVGLGLQLAASAAVGGGGANGALVTVRGFFAE